MLHLGGRVVAVGDAAAPPNAEPAKLVWDAPVETRDVTVPFTFVDLPMPGR